MRTCRGGHVGVFFLLVLSSSSTQCERMSRLFSPVLLRCRLPCGRLLLRYYRFTATSETRGRIHEKVPSIDDRQSDCRFFLMEPRNHDSHPTPSLPAAPPPSPPIRIGPVTSLSPQSIEMPTVVSGPAAGSRRLGSLSFFSSFFLTASAPTFH